MSLNYNEVIQYAVLYLYMFIEKNNYEVTMTQ